MDIALLDKFLDVGLHGSFAQTCAPPKAIYGGVAAPGIVGMICQREHHQPLGWAKRLALEYRRHKADAHAGTQRVFSEYSGLRINRKAV